MLESLFNKVAGLQACNFIENRLQCMCFPVHIANFYLRTYIWIYIEFMSAKFWNLQTADSDCSFTLAIYLFLALFTTIIVFRNATKKKNHDLLWRRKCWLKLDYAIQWHIILNGMSRSLKYTWWSLMYQF